MVTRANAACRLLALALAACLWVAGLPSLPVLAAAPAEGAKATTSLRAAILPLAVDGELSDADREFLTGELVSGLERGAFDVVPPTEVAATSDEAATCTESECYTRVATATNATHVVRARVVIQDRDYDVSIELVDGKSGSPIASSSEGCEICGITDAGNLVSTAAATLRTKLDALSRGPSTLFIASTPDGAEVSIDGEIVGTTPLERPVVAGKRILRVSKEGFISVEREVTFVEGVEESLTFELEKVPSRLPSRPWGYVSLGVGVGGIAAAIVFAVLRDRPYKLGGACSADKRDGDGNCPELWNTEYHVLGFAIAGAALTTLGVAILLNSAKRDKKNKAKRSKKRKKTAKRQTQFGIGAGSLILRGRF